MTVYNDIVLDVFANFIIAPYATTRVKYAFPTREIARIQNRIVPEWRFKIREAYEKVLPENIRLRKFITVILPNNGYAALSLMSQNSSIGVRELFIPLKFAPIMLTIFVALCYLGHFSRKAFIETYQNAFPTGFLAMIAPSDWNVLT